MKSNIEYADIIAEEILLGNYECKIMDRMIESAASKFNMSFGDFASLFDKLAADCTQYSKTDSEITKRALADEIVHTTYRLRVSGFLLNNPNTFKHIAQERDFYKSRTIAADERTKDLEDKLKSAYGAVNKLMEDIEKMKLKGFEKRE